MVAPVRIFECLYKCRRQPQKQNKLTERLCHLVLEELTKTPVFGVHTPHQLISIQTKGDRVVAVSRT